MKITAGKTTIIPHNKAQHDLIKGEVHEVAANQIDLVEVVNFSGTKENHRVSYQYNKELSRNVAHIIDNSTGEIVKKALTDAQIDHLIRIERLKGIHLDEKA